MKRFTKLVESIESEKYYKVSSEVDLIIKAENEGEAGYKADSDLGSIPTHSDFRIIDISEITKEEFANLRVTEAAVSAVEKEKEQTAEQKILTEWSVEFGDRPPTAIEKFEFYRRLRDQKFDADVIMNTLKDKISIEWMRKQ